MTVNSSSRKSIIVTAWVFLLLASALPTIFMQEILSQTVTGNLHALMTGGILLLGMALTFVWKTIRPLRMFFLLYLILVIAEWFIDNRVNQLPFYRSWLNNPSFSVSMLAEQSRRLMTTLVVIAALLLIHKHAGAFFLVKGNTRASVEPVKWLGIKDGERWNKLGRLFTVFISLGTLAFLVIAGRPPLNILMRVLPFLPAILIAAALNAFNEEMTYKASFLSVLEGSVGRQPALWLMAANFGLGHYYGVPYGIVGVIMATFLGWFLGKSMLETRGLWWAWFIHFWQDVWIFLFLAIGSIAPGGG